MQSGRLLKANAARELGSKVAFNLNDLEQRGQAYLSEVESKATLFRSDAAVAADRARQETYAQAFAQGRADGLAAAAAEHDQQVQTAAEQLVVSHLQTVLPALANATEALERERHEWVTRWETAAIELSVAIAQKLLRAELARRPELAVNMLTEALNLAAGAAELTLRLNPADCALLGPNPAETVKQLARCAIPTIVPDTAIHPGGCQIFTSHGEVDARLETMLQRVTEELLA